MLNFASALLAVWMAASPAPLTRIEQALQLSAEEAAAGRRVQLRGVVTYADPVTRDFFFSEPDGSGISMWYPDPKVALTQGDLIEVEGHTERGEYAPKIATPLERLQVLAHRQPVPLTRATQAQLTADGLDCRHIATDAVVRDVLVRGEQVELRLATLLGPTRLLFATGVPAQHLSGLVGAEIRVEATVGVDLNASRQRTGLRLYAQSLESLRVVHPALPLSSLGQRSLDRLLQYQRGQPSDPRLVVEGDVIHLLGRQVFIADADAVARLTLAESTAGSPLPPLGVRVRAVGFVEPGEPLPHMKDVRIVETLGPATISPLEVTGRGLLSPGLEDHLVRIEGSLSSVLQEPLQLLSLKTRLGPALVMALEPGLIPADQLQDQVRLSVVGIKGRTSDRATPVVLLRRAEDLRVIASPPFWTARRILAVAGIALLLAGVMVLKWAWAATRARSLERQVAERTAALTAVNQTLEQRSRDLQAQQRELVELHHFRARFIATAAHDLRSELTVIIVNAGMLTREERPANRRVMSSEISQAAEHINDELTRLVRAYRDEHQRLRSEPFDLGEVVEGAVVGAQPFIARKGQRLELRLPPERVWVRGDAAIFGHVVLNVLSNASKFSPSQSRVQVEVRAAAPQVQIVDQGPGLDPEKLARLFDLGELPDARPTGDEPSSGEGLLLCDRWMRTMGGTISCRSGGAPGTVFELSLPAEGAPFVDDQPLA